MKKNILSKMIHTVLLAGVSSSIVFASSHREAPNITEMPKVDGTDFYMFNSYEPGREGNVTLLANYLPLQDAYGGPNYFSMDPDAIYEIHISNDGDAEEEITFQFKFNNKREDIALNVGGKLVAIPLKQAGKIGLGGDVASTAALNEKESFSVKVIYGDRRDGEKYSITDAGSGSKNFMKPVDNIGTKTLPDYTDYADNHIYDVDIPNCGQGRVFVGQRLEGFAVNLGGIFDLVNFVPIDRSFPPFAAAGIIQSDSNNTTLDKNVTTLALEVPARCLTASDTSTTIGGWTTASLKQARVLNSNGIRSRRNNPERYTGPWTQVSRLGSPLVNEVVIGLKDKDLFNRSEPKDDVQFADYVTNPTLPALLDILFNGAVNDVLGLTGDGRIANLAPTNFPRTDLVAAFLTGFENVNQTSGASEMLRLNTAIPATEQSAQHNLGVAGGDLAGFPNGRRPGDDVVDVALRVVMGGLCHDLPLGAEGGGVNLGLCTPANAVVGNVPFIDGAPVDASYFRNAFPYLQTPLPGNFETLGTVLVRDIETLSF